jgi:hypothetical protein
MAEPIRIGERYGALVVIAETERADRASPTRGTPILGDRRFECRCDCGRIVVLPFHRIRRPKRPSCGCLVERHGATKGRSRTTEYTSWVAMTSRCHDDKHVSYADYGGRGIRVAEEWRGPGGFGRFLAHIGPKPSSEHTIDRFPDGKGNYEPGNVRWATRAEQHANRSITQWLEVDGMRRTLAEWSALTGLAIGTLYHRVHRGWDPKDVVSRPARARRTQ